MSTGLLLTLALLGAPSAAAPIPLDRAVAEAAASPTDSFSRLRIGQALARTPGRADEAVAALTPLLDDPEDAYAAAEALAVLLLDTPPRRAWLPAIDGVLRQPDFARSQRLLAWRARARAHDAAGIASALDETQRLLAAYPDDAEVIAARAEVLLRGGRPAEAAALVSGRERLDTLDDLLAPIRVAAGQYEAALDAAGTSGLGMCAGAAAVIPCARFLADRGFPDAALAGLAEALGDPATGGADRAALLVAVGSYQPPEDATRSYRRALDADPSSATARTALTLALLGSGDLGGARAVAGSDPALQATLFAVQLVSGDPVSGDGPDLEAVARAQSLDDSNPLVLAASARVYAEHRRWGAALDAARALLALSPADRGALALAAEVGLAARQADFAVDAVRRGLAATDDPEDWRALADELARLLAADAEARKDAGELEGATANYLVATAVLTDSPPLLIGLGGALWDGERLAEAEAVFRRAAALPGAALEPTLLLAELLQTQGRIEEARQALSATGLSDARVTQLEQQLSVDQVAKRAAAQGKSEEIIAAYQELMAQRPNDPQLYKALGDALVAARHPTEAASAYRRARALDPQDPWATLGIANALVASGDPSGAEDTLADIPPESPTAVLRERRRTERRIMRARADALRAGGQDMAAYTLYIQLVNEAADDTWALSGLGELYMLHQQYSEALLFFEEAAAADPSNEQAGFGQVRALTARGEFERASSLIGALAEAGLDQETLDALWDTLALARTLRRAESARAVGSVDGALELLEDALAERPGHPDLVAAWAQMRVEGDPQAAFEAARAILDYQDPTHEGALGAAAAAAEAMGRPQDALPLLDRALAGGVGDWVFEARQQIVLQLALADAAALARPGRPRAAWAAVGDIESQALATAGDTAARSDGARAQRLQLLGGTWLALGYPERALPMFEEALALAPALPGAAVGLASAQEALGHPGRAVDTLAAHWRRYHALTAGEALVKLQTRRGRYRAAADIADEVERYRLVLVDSQASPPLGPLPLATAPSGRAPPPDAEHPTVRALSDLELAALHQAATDPTPVDAEVGLGWVWRPGAPTGGDQLRAALVPVGVELAPTDLLRLSIEAVPVWVSDDQETQRGASLTAGLATPWLAAPVAARAAIGLSPVGFDQGVYVTGFGMLSARPHPGVELRVTGTRAPVTQSLLAWAGTLDGSGAPYGRLADSWLSAQLAARSHGGAEAGLAGNLGALDGLQIAAPVGWRQLVLWGRAPVWGSQAVDLRLGVDAQALTHEAWIGDFTPGEGGVFTPQLYLAGAGSGELTVTLPPDTAALCAGVDIGPQYVQGVGTSGLAEGWRAGSSFNASARLSLAPSWRVLLGVSRQSVWSGWQQNTALVQLRYGERASGAYTPGETTGSSAHGIPFQEPGACWDRVSH